MYSVDFTLHVYDTSVQTIKNALAEFGEGLAVSDCPDCQGRGRDFKVNLNTENPETVFDICAQFGRIKSVKIDEVR